jgi:hypothetical protein
VLASRPLLKGAAVETRDDDPPQEALRRLIGYAERLPLPCRRDVESHLFSVQEWFSLLRRLGVESVCLAHQGRRVDSSLLLEVGALTTNRLIALSAALSDEGFSRQSFFALMHSQVESHRGMDSTWAVRTLGVQALVAATSKLGLLEGAVLLAPGEDSSASVRREAADCAVYIGFFVEAMRRRVP